jgi:hypothetical protein
MRGRQKETERPWLSRASCCHGCCRCALPQRRCFANRPFAPLPHLPKMVPHNPLSSSPLSSSLLAASVAGFLSCYQIVVCGGARGTCAYAAAMCVCGVLCVVCCALCGFRRVGRLLRDQDCGEGRARINGRHPGLERAHSLNPPAGPARSHPPVSHLYAPCRASCVVHRVSCACRVSCVVCRWLRGWLNSGGGCGGAVENTEAVGELGAVDSLVRLLAHPNNEVLQMQVREPSCGRAEPGPLLRPRG